jgi:hypothetical protein
MKRSVALAWAAAAVLTGAAASPAPPDYDADVGPARGSEHPAAPSVRALRDLAPGGYVVWGHPIVVKGAGASHLWIADTFRPTATGKDDEVDLGEIEGTLKAPPEKKRRYAVRIAVREADGKTIRTIVPIRP